MAENRITAYFSSMDQALSAETSLRALGGVDITVERRNVEGQPAVFPNFAALNATGQGIQPYGAGYSFGPYNSFVSLQDGAIDSDPVHVEGKENDVMLTCSVAEDQWQDAANIIFKNGGNIS